MNATGDWTGMLGSVWSTAVDLWIAGGWCMWPIGFVAFVMFGIGMHVWLGLRRKGFRSVPESRWRLWITDARARRGPIGELLEFVAREPSLEAMGRAFQEVNAAELAPFRRDLRLMKVCIAAAPLLGLLGTVTGMLATFQALATGSGGDQTMGMIAKGISEALITTEAGLVVALPGVFFAYLLGRGFDHYQAFLAHVETVCSQEFHRAQRAQAVPA